MAQKDFSEKKMANVISQAREWFADFKESKFFKKMSVSAQNNSEQVIFTFSEQMYLTERRASREWTAASLELILMTSIPQELSEYDTFKDNISEVLSNYFEYLKETKKINNADTLNRKLSTLSFTESQELPKTKTATKKAPQTKQTSSSTTSKSKTETTYSKDEIERFNQFVMGSVLSEIRGGTKEKEEPQQPTTKVVGRNELCPCGSGKKYKRCHGK